MNQIQELRRELDTKFREALRLLDQLELETSRPAPPTAAPPPPQGLVALTTWCRDNYPPLRTARRWLEPGMAPPGLAESKAIVRVGTRWLVHPARMVAFLESCGGITGQDQPEPDPLKRGPGRPRRAV